MPGWKLIPPFIADYALQMAECNFDDSRIDEGISLFNAAEYFACHDVLEDFWGGEVKEVVSVAIVSRT